MTFFKWFIYFWFMLIICAFTLIVIGMTMQWLQGGLFYV